ncbi:MAG: head-tail connector protein [Micavibrio sp.]|nr:head-tail connector protein [Micavibrio sp.]
MKNLTLLSPPALEPVTLADMKTHLRLTHSAEDTLVQNLITAARQACEAFTGLALQTQSWRLQLDRAAEVIALPKSPVQAITTITCDGMMAAPESYRLDNAGMRLVFLDTPQTVSRFNGIVIDYTAGFGDGAEDVPALLRQGIRQLTARLYEQRGDGAMEALLPSGAASLFQPFRVMGLS